MSISRDDKSRSRVFMLLINIKLNEMAPGNTIYIGKSFLFHSLSWDKFKVNSENIEMSIVYLSILVIYQSYNRYIYT